MTGPALSALPALPVSLALPIEGGGQAPDRNTDRIEAAAQEFEAMVLAELLAPLFNSLDHEGPGGAGREAKAFQGMMNEHYARALAEGGGVGIAASIKRALIELQTTQAKPATTDLPQTGESQPDV